MYKPDATARYYSCYSSHYYYYYCFDIRKPAHCRTPVNGAGVCVLLQETHHECFLDIMRYIYFNRPRVQKKKKKIKYIHATAATTRALPGSSNYTARVRYVIIYYYNIIYVFYNVITLHTNGRIRDRWTFILILIFYRNIQVHNAYHGVRIIHIIQHESIISIFIEGTQKLNYYLLNYVYNKYYSSIILLTRFILWSGILFTSETTQNQDFDSKRS